LKPDSFASLAAYPKLQNEPDMSTGMEKSISTLTWDLKFGNIWEVIIISPEGFVVIGFPL
jgi:hypothetical protein